MARPLPEILGELREALAEDRLVLSPEQAVAAAEQWYELELTAKAGQVQALRTAYELDATSQVCGRSVKQWLIEDRCLSGVDASQRIRLVRQLPAFPVVRAAFEATMLSTAHTCAVLTALQTLPPALREHLEAPLVEAAQHGTPEDVRRLLDELLIRLGLEKKADADRERRLGSRGLSLAKTFDGMYALSGTLSPEVGELVKQALRQANDGNDDRDQRSLRQRDHDALGVIARSYLDHGDKPVFKGAPVGVMVTMPLELLENAAASAWVSLPSGMQIGPDTARRLACDAELMPAVLGSAGEVLDLGRATAVFNAAIRRAAWLEQAGMCAFPNCRRRCVELHHIVWWSRGGRTALDNAAWLCAYHHWLVHEGGWTMRRNPDRSFTFTSPFAVEHTRHLQAA